MLYIASVLRTAAKWEGDFHNDWYAALAINYGIISRGLLFSHQFEITPSLWDLWNSGHLLLFLAPSRDFNLITEVWTLLFYFSYLSSSLNHIQFFSSDINSCFSDAVLIYSNSKVILHIFLLFLPLNAFKVCCSKI